MLKSERLKPSQTLSVYTDTQVVELIDQGNLMGEAERTSDFRSPG